MTSAGADRIMWIDLETTGVDLQTCQVLEVGVVLTHGLEQDLKVIDDWSTLVIPDGWPDTIVAMEPEAREMHRSNGLLQEIEQRVHGGPAIEPLPTSSRVDRLLAAWMSAWSLTSSVLVAGSGVDRFDIPIIRRVFPTVAARFGWRTLDTSSMRQMALQLGRDDLVPPRGADGREHRALDDCINAIEVARRFTRGLRPIVDAALPEREEQLLDQLRAYMNYSVAQQRRVQSLHPGAPSALEVEQMIAAEMAGH